MMNKAWKRDNLIKDAFFDVKLDKPKLNDGRKFTRKNRAKNDTGVKRTTKSIEVTSIQLLGHYETDIDGRNLVMDEPRGIRVYCLPIDMRNPRMLSIEEDSGTEEIVDDWEQLAEENPASPTKHHAPEIEVIITNCKGLNFNLLDGYIPMIDGGNCVGFAGRIRDRTACMRWMVKNHKKISCKNGSRLFDVDFSIRNGAIRKIMTSQFDIYAEEVHLAVIYFKGTYFIWDVTFKENDDELNNKRSFGGLRFEDFASRGIDGSENGPSSGEDNNYNDSMKYYNVVKLNFGGHKMLISGEVDCVIPGSSAAQGMRPKLDDFIELKTSAPLEDKYNPPQMSRFFRSGKTISWFAQCILMGVKHVVVGIREEDDNRMACNKTRVFSMEKLRQHSDGSWSKNRCFDALNKFLSIVKEKITEENPEVINCFKLKEGVFSDVTKKSVSDDEHLPNISEIVDLFEKLQHQI